MLNSNLKYRIGLNATCFNSRSSGAKQRFLGIYSNLIKVLNNSIFIIYEPSNYSLSKYFEKNKNVIIKKTPINSDSYLSKIIISYFFWSKEFKNEKFDIFEFFNLPFYYSNKFVNFMTIHDIRGMHSQYNFIGKFFYKLILRYAVRNIDKIITVSNFMKNDILNHHKEAKVEVIYNGISYKDYEDLSVINSEKTIKNMNLLNNFLLSVGHLEKRKNFLNLIKAFYKIKKIHKDLSLVLIGNDSDEKKAIIKLINSLNLKKSVILLEGLSDFEVKYIYRKAKLFIFPSLYEGFGIPILESMISGCPIILSNIEVFREITENKCPYFDPLDVNSISQTIEKYFLESPERDVLITYGYNRVNDFEYKKIADQVIRLYISILNK
jgi:glycosyltransferase involved in cell wall biosynthesis